MISRTSSFIKEVVVYKGHKKHPLLGPYAENIVKRIDMFKGLNAYREKTGKPKWNVTAVAGENLIEVLKRCRQSETLLVIPAGQSSYLDKVFSLEQTDFIKNEFFEKGGRGYFNCGSAYWVSEKRVYKDLCTEQEIVKTTQIPLFKGISEGPLCPYPGKKYNVGFFSDAVRVTDGNNECTIYLSGGGSFFPEKKSDQKTGVLVKYIHSELMRLGKPLEECSELENAVILASVGKGAVLLSMFHPPDFDTLTSSSKLTSL